jgi:hypothetical protein
VVEAPEGTQDASKPRHKAFSSCDTHIHGDLCWHSEEPKESKGTAAQTILVLLNQEATMNIFITRLSRMGYLIAK